MVPPDAPNFIDTVVLVGAEGQLAKGGFAKATEGRREMKRRGGGGVKGLLGLAGLFVALWLTAAPPPAHAQRAFVRIAFSGSTTGFYFVATGLAKVIEK